MFWKTIFIIFCIFISCFEANANTFSLDEEKSKITYNITKFGFSFKRKALPTTGEIDLSEDLKMLKELKIKTKFISTNYLFRKFIDFDKYPDFQFVSILDKPIPIDGVEVIELLGDVLFHGVTKRISIKLNNKSTDKKIILVGYLNIEMSNFGLAPPRFIFFTMDDLIKNKVELVADYNL